MNGGDAKRIRPAHRGPRVSVLLPVRNGVATLGRAVASIQAQTFSDWELIVIEDGSTDDTRARLIELARNEPRLRTLLRPAEGIVASLNAGLALARGAFIARMDADDVSHPERLAEQVALLEARPEIGVASCLVGFGGERGASEGYAQHVDWINTLVTPEEIRLNRFIESPLAHPSVMFRRELVDKLGAYRNGDFPEDYELWLRWLDAGVHMAKAARVLLCWNDPPMRMSRVDARYSTEAFFRMKAEWIAREMDHCAGGRDVFVWGAGRPTRKRAAHLETHGVRIAAYIDIDAKKITEAIGGTGRPVVAPGALPAPGAIFVLGYVAARGAKELIRNELGDRDYVEGRDFLMCA